MQVARISSAARQTVSGYLPFVSGPFRCAVDRMGVEPITPTVQKSVAPNGMPARRLLAESFIRALEPASTSRVGGPSRQGAVRARTNES